MAIGAIRGEKKKGWFPNSKLHVVMVAARVSAVGFFGIPIFYCMCAVRTYMWFVAALLWRFFFAFSVILPSQLPVCGHGGSFDELTVMFVRFLISVPHCIQVQYVVRHWQGILTDYPADFLHYSDNIHSGFRRRVCVAFNLARMA
jgi:hypothetical protein